MSALPPKADMFSIEINVCFVPLSRVTVLEQWPQIMGSRARHIAYTS
jgi:hypothetical protein